MSNNKSQSECFKSFKMLQKRFGGRDPTGHGT